jgi:radical SAM superfamily enzyme YgiQ (UPF0313 family)
VNSTEKTGNINKKGKIVGINARFTHSCLALFYLRNELHKFCPTLHTELQQFTINDNYYEILLRLSDGEPDLIFFSAAIWNSSLVEKLTLDLVQCLPHCRIIIGGPQAEVLEKRLPAGTSTVVTGEIEAVGKSFYHDLMEDNLHQQYHGHFFSMKQPCFDYPYRPEDFAGDLLNRHIYYESSRGCPFSCSYCLSSAEKGVFHKDFDTVKEELSDILSHRPKVLRFIDRTFNDIPDRALEIWKFLMAHGGNTLFHFELAPDRFTEEMFVFLQSLEPDRFQFEIGIQSTNFVTLAAVKRRIDFAKASVNIRRLVAQNTIHLHVDLILGLPHETRDTYAESFRQVFAVGAHYIQMGLLKVLPNTPLSGAAREQGYLSSREPPYSILQNSWIDHQTLSELYWFSECVEKFYNNRYFVSLWAYLREEREDVHQFFMELLAICKESGFFTRAATQELLCEKLIDLTARRPDSELLIELLRYDWLRCNNRYLPDCLALQSDEEQPRQIRSELYKLLPMEIEGVYDKTNRNQFFRKSYFLRISEQTAARITGSVDSERTCLCFTAVAEDSLYKFNTVILL